jgi:peptidoglycan/LPS O-acetylase OafA/YrhL
MLSHCYITFPEGPRAQFEGEIWSKMLRPFTNSALAVIVFFVLSGYVLALPYIRGTQIPYRHFLVRRFCRIYIPFAASLSVALLLYHLTDRRPIRATSTWFNTLWPLSMGLSGVAKHLLMLGTAANIKLNPVMWSLIYEMRISLLFPLLIMCCKNSTFAIVGALSVLATSDYALSLSTQHYLLRALKTSSLPSFGPFRSFRIS